MIQLVTLYVQPTKTSLSSVITMRVPFILCSMKAIQISLRVLVHLEPSLIFLSTINALSQLFLQLNLSLFGDSYLLLYYLMLHPHLATPLKYL